jgi:hypothetical protein
MTACVSANAEQFSIKCAREFTYFLTFDTVDNRVVYEIVQDGAYKGRIRHFSMEKIEFYLTSVGAGRRELVWDVQEGKVTWLPGEPDDRTRSLHVDACARTDLRGSILRYDEIPPVNP